MSAISLSSAPLFLNPPILPITWYCFEKPSSFIIIPTFSSISSLSWIPLMTTIHVFSLLFIQCLCNFLFQWYGQQLAATSRWLLSSSPDLILVTWQLYSFPLIPPSISAFPGSSSPSISPSHPSVSPDPFPAAATFRLSSPQFLHNCHNTILWHCLTIQPSQLPQTFAVLVKICPYTLTFCVEPIMTQVTLQSSLIPFYSFLQRKHTSNPAGEAWPSFEVISANPKIQEDKKIQRKTEPPNFELPNHHLPCRYFYKLEIRFFFKPVHEYSCIMFTNYLQIIMNSTVRQPPLPLADLPGR